MKLKNNIIILGTLAMLFSSCATILDGSKTRIVVRGNVPATVYFNGQKIGTTSSKTNIIKKGLNRTGKTNLSTDMPIQDKLRIRKASLKTGGKLTIKADGYEPQDISIYRKARTGFVILDVVTGIVPVFVDFANGNIYGVKPRKVNYELQKKSN